jgi:hypothetical protein
MAKANANLHIINGFKNRISIKITSQCYFNSTAIHTLYDLIFRFSKVSALTFQHSMI